MHTFAARLAQRSERTPRFARVMQLLAWTGRVALLEQCLYMGDLERESLRRPEVDIVVSICSSGSGPVAERRLISFLHTTHMSRQMAPDVDVCVEWRLSVGICFLVCRLGVRIQAPSCIYGFSLQGSPFLYTFVQRSLQSLESLHHLGM